MNLKFSLQKIYYYFVVIAFLFPRGFSELNSTYHHFASGIVWIAVLLILFHENTIFVKKPIFKFNELFFPLYFVIAILITFLNRGINISGLQQLFAIPILCIFIVSNIHKHPKELFETFISVFIIELILNLIFNLLFFKTIEHITFLGHVQLVSQFGITALLMGALYWSLFKTHKYKLLFLFVMTFATMFTADADSAVLSAMILSITYIVYKWKLYHIFCLKAEIYLFGMSILNLLVIYLTAVNRNIISGLDFSGRSFVWADALLKIMNKPLFGYGIDGVLLHTFWTEWTGGGFNYAHNQLLQNMLDGGVVLTIVFWCMILGFSSKINSLKQKRNRVLFNSALITLLFIMIFDCPTLYCYMFIVFSIIYVFPSLETITQIKEHN